MDTSELEPAARAAAQVDIVIPVTARERDLAPSVAGLHSFLATAAPFTARVTIADGTDRYAAWATASRLAATFPEVSAIRTGAPGRGRAVRAAWARSRCDVLAYADTDLSIDPATLIPLVAPLLAEQSDLAVGTRLRPGAHPQRGPRREVTSCGYSLLVQAGLSTGLADPQCGLKAITRVQARELLPLTSDDGWFFDAELLALANEAGLRIQEVAVNCERDPGSRTSRMRVRRWLSGRNYRGNAA